MNVVMTVLTCLSIYFFSMNLARSDEPPIMVVVNDPTVVFDHADQCEPMDLPDAPLRAFRQSNGSVTAFSTHYINRALTGPSLTKLSHKCTLVYEGKHLKDPALFDDRTWITATWTADGVNIAALGHNEYQADKFPGECIFKNYTQCWYNAIVPLVSRNSGVSFTRVDYPTPVAAAPFKNDVDQGKPRGFFSPTNIIELNGAYFTLVGQSGFNGDSPGRCLFRTSNVFSPKSWAVLSADGGFISTFGSPYDPIPKTKLSCQSATGLPGFLGSLLKVGNTDYVAAFTIGSSSDSAKGGYIDVSFSKDLLHWTHVVHLMEVTPAWSKDCPDGVRYSYPSVLSDEDHGRNFESAEKSAWLFLISISCSGSARDLIRFPVRMDLHSNGPSGRNRE